ncbi:uncharacterized protein N7477_000180 [Penicillium maclennaniae]|uniref:uncharacterized protein n=1 Tax=Penicillium maclennaniae TaxID=1343394 RepID=UPI0025424A4F|nr:uncharacterized protein N7477_000180 [Penicillium maclennaniae]KAJ5683835.1 hypothetical protein N7477_000180 [Penicillium maclennaniae]
MVSAYFCVARPTPTTPMTALRLAILDTVILLAVRIVVSSILMAAYVLRAMQTMQREMHIPVVHTGAARCLALHPVRMCLDPSDAS